MYVYVCVIFLCVLYINAGKLVFYALAQKLIGRQMHNALTYKHICVYVCVYVYIFSSTCILLRPMSALCKVKLLEAESAETKRILSQIACRRQMLCRFGQAGVGGVSEGGADLNA